MKVILALSLVLLLGCQEEAQVSTSTPMDTVPSHIQVVGIGEPIQGNYPYSEAQLSKLLKNAHPGSRIVIQNRKGEALEELHKSWSK